MLSLAPVFVMSAAAPSSAPERSRDISPVRGVSGRFLDKWSLEMMVGIERHIRHFRENKRNNATATN